VTVEANVHETSTSLAVEPAVEVRGSAEMALKARVSCSSACDLWGQTVKVIAQDGTVVGESVLTSFDGTASETDEFAVRVPFEPGDYVWTVVFPAQERKGTLHEESSAPLSFIVTSHATSVEVWDVPSPIGLGDEFEIKVGVRCSSDCVLAGQTIEIYDHEGTEAGTGTLSDDPLPDTTALYWAEMELKAPAVEGRHRWTVNFPQPDPDSPHEEASSTFTFVTARHPEHVVTIQVVDKDAKTPTANAHVRLRPRAYRGSTYMVRTDEDGVARLNVPRGVYQLYAWGEQYEKMLPSIEVESDLTVQAELSKPRGSWRMLPLPTQGKSDDPTGSPDDGPSPADEPRK
jgi:hypothetical protein